MAAVNGTVRDGECEQPIAIAPDEPRADPKALLVQRIGGARAFELGAVGQELPAQRMSGILER
jgi:hypothetical protein